MNYTIYDDQGKIISTYGSSDLNQVEEYLADKNYVEGLYSSEYYYISDGQPITKPTNPSTNTLVYNFNYTTKEWDLDKDKTEHKIKYVRSILFEAVDKVNPLWYVSMSEQQKTELAAYRQALLDITKQSEYPLSIVWPVKPKWL
jgi:hypothetical protein